MTYDPLSIRTPLASLEAAIGFTNFDRDLDAYALRVSATLNANLNASATLRAIAKFRASGPATRMTKPASQ